MKRIGMLSFVVIMALVVALAAQAPQGGGPGGGGRGPGGPGGAGGGPGGGGRGGQGGGGRGGGAAAAARAALQAIADSIATAIGKQDAATLTKMLGMGALYLDEDGHAIPGTAWVTKLTTGTAAKTFTINSSHGEMLDDNAAWLSFNYSLGETFQNAPKTITGTASFALKKVGTDWMIQMIHGALTQHVAGMTQ